MNPEPKDPTQDRLRRVLEGEQVDWKGAPIPAALLKTRLFDAAARPHQFAISLINARIDGDLVLDEIGAAGSPLAFQILGCRLGGLRARSSRWRHLVVARSQLDLIDLGNSRSDGDVAIELCAAAGYLRLSHSRIGGALSLKGSSFNGSDAHEAVSLSGATVGRDFNAGNVTICGCLQADRLDVTGNATLDGAQLDGRAGDDDRPKALDLARAKVGGMLQLAPGERRFVAHGRVHLDAGKFGAITIKGARLDGCGQPAIVADQCHVDETLDLSGVTDRGGDRLEIVGQVRFCSATIGRQVQFFDAAVSGNGELLMLHSVKTGGDILIGHSIAPTRIEGRLGANMADVGGRLALDNLSLVGADAAIDVRQARVAREITCFSVEATGPLSIDNTAAGGLQIERVRLERDDLPQIREGLPEPYSQSEDVLLELSFIELAADLRCEDLVVRNGTVRLVGAKIPGGAQFSRIAIAAGGRLALLAQAAELGGLHIAGAPGSPAPVDGEVSLIGASVKGGITLSDVWLGTEASPSRLVLHGVGVAGSILLNEIRCHGQVSVGSATIGGDLHFHSSSLLNPGKACCDLREVNVGGKLQWATVRREGDEIAARIAGLVTADGAVVGALSWHAVSLADNSALALTNMQVARRIDANTLVCEGAAQVDLSGTTTPLLVDRLGDSDSWGEARLGLDNFAFGQLAHPSGGNGDGPGEIARRRAQWLAKRFDLTSARPARHLAQVLRQQGLFEASRRILVGAFEAEAAARPTPAGRMAGGLFGLLFGHGLSGLRATMTLALLWLVGVIGVLALTERDLLVATDRGPAGVPRSCTTLIDPVLYPLDVIIPLDLGEESRCEIGAGRSAVLRDGHWLGGRHFIGATLPTLRFLAVLYRLAAWITLSLAIATWSGLFKRMGRE